MIAMYKIKIVFKSNQNPLESYTYYTKETQAGILLMSAFDKAKIIVKAEIEILPNGSMTEFE